ncbi:MAG: 2-oxo-4-hydroxy-4-carboxy-5-ureidoimidazoline decarboxylase [Beijerinckiaceae bacterium]|nr:2-oxo-4-hydroxy-4-carboxy-5-ureidoimidazoline decarboxylase [Beijerinckiaceae bacterium]
MGIHPLIAELDRLNVASREAFVARLGELYEHSPWIAERAWEQRPFRHLRHLHDCMQSVVEAASQDEKIALFRAHPELAGKEALDGTLTAASSGEQGRLGIDRLSGADLDWLSRMNRAYRDRHGFPCIVALRRHASRQTVFSEIQARTEQGTEAEIAAAIEQIGIITRGRLAEMFGVLQGRLTMHVLDTVGGCPAAGMRYALLIDEAGRWTAILSGVTDGRGRTDQPLLTDIDLRPVRYRLEFAVADYFRGSGMQLADPPFLDVVPIEFGVGDPTSHYHVPLLCTPWSFSTYRGN